VFGMHQINVYDVPLLLGVLANYWANSFWHSLQDEMFQKFNFDTEWAVRLISKITNDETIPIEGDAIVNQVII